MVDRLLTHDSDVAFFLQPRNQAFHAFLCQGFPSKVGVRVRVVEVFRRVISFRFTSVHSSMIVPQWSMYGLRLQI